MTKSTTNENTSAPPSLEEMDIAAFGFIQHVKPYSDPGYQFNSTPNLKGEGTGEAIDLGEVNIIGLAVRNPNTGDVQARYKRVNDKYAGLESTAFIEFQELLSNIASHKAFSQRCDYAFIEENGFEWLMDLFASQTAKCSLTVLLLDKITDETKPYRFFFRMSGFAIQDDILIGKAVISARDKLDAKEYWQRMVEASGKNVDNVEGYTDFEGVTISVEITSTYERAKTTALREAELAVAILKCFCVEYSLNQEYAIPYLGHKDTNYSLLKYWWLTRDKPFKPLLNWHNRAGLVPIQIDNNFVDRANQLGLLDYSHFIAKSYHDELSLEIIVCLERFADIASTYSHHEKIVKMIALLEGPITARPSTGKNRGESRIKDSVIPKLTSQRIDLFQSAIRYGYGIRNAYVHNNQLLRTEFSKTLLLIEIARAFIQKLVQVHGSGKRSFEDIAIFFGIS